MAIVLLCESSQQFRALMMISQYHKTLSISMMLSQCPISCVSEISQVLSPVLFRQSPFTCNNYTCRLFAHGSPTVYHQRPMVHEHTVSDSPDKVYGCSGCLWYPVVWPGCELEVFHYARLLLLCVCVCVHVCVHARVCVRDLIKVMSMNLQQQ